MTNKMPGVWEQVPYETHQAMLEREGRLLLNRKLALGEVPEEIRVLAKVAGCSLGYNPRNRTYVLLCGIYCVTIPEEPAPTAGMWRQFIQDIVYDHTR